MYTFKIVPELLWALGTGIAIALFEAAVDFDESVFAADPVAFGVAIVGMVVRAAGAAGLTVLTKGAFVK
jgi:hypothetical protein